MHPLSGPLQPGLRFFRDPLPTTDARQFTPPLVAPCGATPLWAYPVPCGEHGPGGPRLSAGDRHVSVPPPSREAAGHTPFGSSLSVDLARSSLTAFISDSQMLALWPSLAPHPDFDFQNRTANLTVAAHPRGAATLSARSARGRYQPRTAPRLRAAERPVASRLAPVRQLTTRLTPSAFSSVSAFTEPPDPRVRDAGSEDPLGRSEDRAIEGLIKSLYVATGSATERHSGRTLGKLPFCH